jgi:hypothetical protein
VEEKLEKSNKYYTMTPEEYTFSICTLVKDKKNYEILIESLRKNDFLNGENEVLKIDNSSKNIHDCYSAIREFINNSKRKYIILTHDDVVINNCKQDLIDQLKKIHSIDQSAAVFGAAGIYKSHLKGAGHFISHKGKEYWGFHDNGRVLSLDECFIIINKSSGITVSDNLNGFHFYGTDICLNATKKGFSCYAINYPITHVSQGKIDDSFLISREKFISHLKKTGINDVISTTCTTLYSGNSFFLKAFSLALTIAKLKLGEHSNSNYVKQKIFNDISNNYPQKTTTLIIYYLIIIYYNSIFLKRIIGDLNWWKNNWRSRIPFMISR